MTKFTPQPKQRQSADRDNIVLGVRVDTSDLLSKIATERSITKQDLIRQMIHHCLTDMGHTVNPDQSVAPTARAYKRKKAEAKKPE